jgi:sec-independent protein translocase protein TatA
MFGISPATMILLLVVGVLLFGKDLPDVARRLGKGLLDIRRSLQGLHEEMVDDRPSRPSEPVARPQRPPQKIAPTARKFEDDPPVDA